MSKLPFCAGYIVTALILSFNVPAETQLKFWIIQALVFGAILALWVAVEAIIKKFKSV